YSSAVYNDFLQELDERSMRQVVFADAPDPDRGLTEAIAFGSRGRSVYVTPADVERIGNWLEAGFTQAMKTPDDTMIYVRPETGQQIRRDQVDCMGCLSACKFSNWSCNEKHTTGRPPDPRSFCIQKTLQDIAHTDDVDHQLMFAGHNAYKFGQDPFYSNGFIPTVRQLVDRIATGD
ncbi:MAG: nitronate monooxygenase, partial [Pseudomonadota bacterium]